MGKALRILWVTFQAVFIAAALYQAWVNFGPEGASVRVVKNANDRTALNHGQKYVDVSLPTGVSFESFGGCSPMWFYSHASYEWRTLTCSVELFDSKVGRFVEAGPGEVWVGHK